MSIQNESVDVVVVGAGFAGLSAAHDLVDQERSVVVLEGRDRVGGRVCTGEIAGVKVDLGGTWVAKQHTAIRAIAEQVGATLVPQFITGRSVLSVGGKQSTYTGTIPKISPVALVNMGRIQYALDKLAKTIDVDAPWNSPRAAELDAISLEEWLGRKGARATTRALLTIVTKVEWGCRPSQVSLLHVLRTIRAFGGFDFMLDAEGGMQESRYVETTQGIAIRYAELLGDRVRTSAPVRRITQDGDRVTVSTDTDQISAKYVIITTATEHRGDIEFEPALSDPVQGLIKSWGLGALSKAFVAYDKPFWRAKGLSGESATDTATVFATFDVSPSADGPGILMAFCDPIVFDAHAPEIRKDQVVKQLTDLFGSEAARPIDYIDQRWNEEAFASGGPNPVVAPYASTRYGSVLTEPHGRVHWGGTETAGEWTGSMNGAVLSGRRAAADVAQLLALTETSRKEKAYS